MVYRINPGERGFFDSLTKRVPGCGRVAATRPVHLFLGHSTSFLKAASLISPGIIGKAC